MGGEHDDFSGKDSKKELLTKRVKLFHERMTSLNLEEIEERRRALGVRIYRFCLLFVGEISRTELPRRAAALTYTTILSLFPLLAVISATASFFYTEEKEEEFMNYIETQFLPSVEKVPMLGMIDEGETEEFSRQQENVQRVRGFFSNVSTRFRENAGGVGTFGFIGILITAGILYYSIESVVNQTWQEQHKGHWSQTLTNFVTILVFAPIVIGLSLTTTTLAVTLLDPNLETEDASEFVVHEETSADQDTAMMGPPPPEELDRMEEELSANNSVVGSVRGNQGAGESAQSEEKKRVSPFIIKVRSITKHFAFLLPTIPIVVNTFILTLAFSFLPKTKVRFYAALIGGFIAAVLFELAKYLFVFYIYMSSINRSLADAFGLAVIFLIWVYITWLILLLGNLLVYIVQNFSALWTEKKVGADIALDSRLYLTMMILLARRFLTAGSGYSEHDLRIRMGLNMSEFRMIIERLQKYGYVAVLQDESYQICRPPEQIYASELLGHGCNLSNLPIARRGHTQLGILFQEIENKLVGICDNKTLRELAEEAAPLKSAGVSELDPDAPDDGMQTTLSAGKEAEDSENE